MHVLLQDGRTDCAHDDPDCSYELTVRFMRGIVDEPDE